MKWVVLITKTKVRSDCAMDTRSKLNSQTAAPAEALPVRNIYIFTGQTHLARPPRRRRQECVQAPYTMRGNAGKFRKGKEWPFLGFTIFLHLFSLLNAYAWFLTLERTLAPSVLIDVLYAQISNSQIQSIARLFLNKLDY